MTFLQYNIFIFSYGGFWFDILLFYFILIYKELIPMSENFHNIFIFSFGWTQHHILLFYFILTYKKLTLLQL